MKLAGTASPIETQSELEQFLAASALADFMAIMFSPHPRRVRLRNAGAGVFTGYSSLHGYTRNGQLVRMWRDNPRLKPM